LKSAVPISVSCASVREFQISNSSADVPTGSVPDGVL
jgi:hypothetical protein